VTKSEDPGDKAMSGARTGPERDDGRAWCGGADLEEEKPKRGTAADEANHRLRCTYRFVDEGLEVQSRARGSRATGERGRDKGREARTGDESERLRGGTKPLNGNPGRGCGMKEAREAEGGESRREVEKT